MRDRDPFIRSIELKRDDVPSFDAYPFNIPSLRALESLPLHPLVTFFVGENGSGKSTLLEGIATSAGFNPEGGSRNFLFATRPSESPLWKHLRLVRGRSRPATGYFLRAESFFNVATEVDRNDVALASHGGKSLHEQSHGESFMALVKHRFYPDGLYLLDEPEAALSPSRQLQMLVHLDVLARESGCQFIIATHSPILMAYPHASIVEFGASGLRTVRYEETENYVVTRDFLLNPARSLRELFGESRPDDALR